MVQDGRSEVNEKIIDIRKNPESTKLWDFFVVRRAGFEPA